MIVQQRGAPNLQFHAPDLGVSLHGQGPVTDFFLHFHRCIPDYGATIHEVGALGEEEDPNTVKVDFTVCGTQVEPCLPIFPLGKFVSWRCRSLLSLDPAGRVRKETVYLRVPPEPELALEPPALEGLAQSVRLLASTASGCRLLQDVLGQAGVAGCQALGGRLRGDVWAASSSPHANHVLQKYITVMPSEHLQFIVEELRGRACEAASHVTQCRVLQRLIEHCPSSQTAGLVEELLDRAGELCRQRFGNYVMQRVLEHGSPDQRSRLVQAIAADAPRLARHKIGSNVVRSALIHGSSEDKRKIIQVLATSTQDLADLAHHCIGSFVARELRHLA